MQETFLQRQGQGRKRRGGAPDNAAGVSLQTLGKTTVCRLLLCSPFCAIGEQMCPCSPWTSMVELGHALTTARNKVPRRGSLSPPACWGRELEEQRRENLWLRIKANLPGNQKPHMQAKLATPSLLPAPMPQWAHLPLCCLLPPHRLHCWSAQPALLGLPCQDSVQQACQIMVVVKQCSCRHRAAAHSMWPWG